MKIRTWINTLLTCCLLTGLMISNPNAQANEDVIRDVPTEQKLIALSFDDGPNPVYTPQVLDLLQRYHAKATFFVIGSRVQKFLPLIQREHAEGHEIANHTYSHRKKLSNEALLQDMAQAQEAIYQATGQEPQLFRPPGGHYNKNVIAAARQAGFKVVLWSSDPRDWSKPGVHKIVQEVVSTLHNGMIVLLHDHGPDRSQTIQALELLLPKLEAQGYQFVTISELLQTGSNRLPSHIPFPHDQKIPQAP